MKKILILTIVLVTALVFEAQTYSKYIVVDQFGYRPTAKKVAILRDPVIGFDSSESFVPGNNYALVNSSTQEKVFTGTPVAWKSGILDSISGDKVWWFDFSSYSEEGTFYILDETQNLKSYEFEINSRVYDDVLKHAVRAFFYQRVGYAKELPFAEAGWTDGASHIGPLQDKNCRPYNAKTDATKEKDLSGGWYDAGDYNKYTIWTANYVYEMLLAFEENKKAFTDDYGLPYSGNGIPDFVDEIQWGMDHLLRLQNSDGSVISIVDEAEASPPSSAKGQSLYGAVNTSSTFAAAAAFAFGEKIFRDLGNTDYADKLKTAALLSFTWGENNPAVIWNNNDAAYGSLGIGAGQQEVDDYGRFSLKLRAAIHLLDLTKESKYKTYIESNYTQCHLIAWGYAFPFEQIEQSTMLYATKLAELSTTVKNSIKSKYAGSMSGDADNIKSINGISDPYRSHLKNYVWGSNGTKSRMGMVFYDAYLYNTNASRNADLLSTSEEYIHYIHGLNPLNLCYLSNMGAKGAENSVKEFYHTWFQNGSAKWDRVGTSTFGPAPGFLVGGPNPSYKKDNCCLSGGSCSSNVACNQNMSPPSGQPASKSYAEFNTSWPLNSWEVTENSNGYQIYYIRLLSKFVDRSDLLGGFDQNGQQETQAINVYPNPSNGTLEIKVRADIQPKNLSVTDLGGNVIYQSGFQNKLNLSHLRSGTYILEVKSDKNSYAQKIIIETK